MQQLAKSSFLHMSDGQGEDGYQQDQKTILLTNTRNWERGIREAQEVFVAQAGSSKGRGQGTVDGADLRGG